MSSPEHLEHISTRDMTARELLSAAEASSQWAASSSGWSFAYHEVESCLVSLPVFAAIDLKYNFLKRKHSTSESVPLATKANLSAS